MSETARYRIVLADCFPRPADADERMARMGLGHLVGIGTWEPSCVTSADVRTVRERHADIPEDAAVDIDFQGMGAVSPGAVRKLWASWPNACFVADEADHMEAIGAGIGQ
jgi:hypothetical protein